MNPVVGLRLTQVELHAMHGLQEVGLLVDQDEPELVLNAWQGAFRSTTRAPLSWLAGACQCTRIELCVCRLKGRHQCQKLFPRESGRSEERVGAVLLLVIVQHTLILHYSR